MSGKKGVTRSDWTPERIAILVALFPKYDNSAIALQLGISERAVRSKAQVLQLKKSARYWLPDDCKWLVDHWGIAGYGFAEIQAHFANKTKWAIVNKYRSLTGKRVDNGRVFWK